ncbi:MAG: oligosaccharide flippase family protein [Clostridium sp.]|nr:oligosaccharide flippase family protein [Clostridium sp.]MCM1398786.1 oligosaccharide flippase family protein [Clostridium sp.]MCM1458582.1 oligosaccharide flippase family protein [Bacteroides sp.]
MDEGRVTNATRNIFFGMILKVYQILLPFFMRTAIMYFMGIKYLGLNGLFSSILLVLNMAELGVGSAMVYSMYEPIIRQDKQEICALLKLYRKYYRIIGGIIAVVGTIVLPFVPHLIAKNAVDEVPPDVNIYIIYLLNLACTVISYWLFAYRGSLLTAHQRDDITSKVSLITNTFQYVGQFLVVIIFKSYYLYLIVSFLTQVLTNIVVAYFSTKKYPEYKPEGELSPEIVKSINQRIKDLFTSRIGMVMVMSMDSIVISIFMGLTPLAIYNNYYYIVKSVITLLQVIYASCTAGIGNSIILESDDKNYNDMKKFTFIVAWLVGICCCCLLCLLHPFMILWAGEENTLGILIDICFTVYFFVDQMNLVLHTYKNAAGIWHEDRFRPLATSFTNLILNIILVQFFGIYGILVASVISVSCVGMPWILHNIFKTMFKRSKKEYVLRLFLYAFITLIACTVCYLACSLVTGAGIGTIIIRLFICAVLSNVVFFLFYTRLKEFGEAKDIFTRIVNRFVKKSA